MSITDETFFTENIIRVNTRVTRILFLALIIPIAFFTLSHIYVNGSPIWIVSSPYCIFLFSYDLIAAMTAYLLNKNPRTQIISMYFNIFAISLFVHILGLNNIILLSISFCFGPLISTLYYKRKFTNIVTLVNFVLLFLIYIYKARVGVSHPDLDNVTWFIQNFTGIVIEFSFLFIALDYLTKRIEKTLTQLVDAKKDAQKANHFLESKEQQVLKQNILIAEKNMELTNTQYKIIDFVGRILGSHDLFTGQHVIHTREYVHLICKELQSEGLYLDELTDEKINIMRSAAFLHDIGKIHIPEGVLNKIGKFTPEEFELMKCHPEEGLKLLEYLPKIENGTYNKIAKEMAYTHHEKWDGTGYPQGLAGTDIPLSGRIMAAADVLDALVSQRLYKDPMSVDEAMDVFKKSSGTHFEPSIVKAVLSCKELIRLADNNFKTSESKADAEELSWWKKYHETLGTLK